MDSETQRRIEETVLEILKNVDMDSVTELNVRAMAAERLSMDLSDLPYKKFIRHLIDSFLLSIHDDDPDDKESGGALRANSDANTVTVVEELDDTKPDAAPIAKDAGGDWSRLICKLSNKRHVTVTGSEGKTVVSIKEFYGKDGKHSSSPKGIVLTSEQWSAFKKSIPAIEAATAKIESRLRMEFQKKGNEDMCDRSGHERNRSMSSHYSSELPKQKIDISNKTEFAGKRVGKKSNDGSTPNGLVPIEVIRFDGKNYHQWEKRMELLLKQLKVAYVLVDPCPSAIGASTEVFAQVVAAAQKWMDDDYICRLNILNSLSDHLFSHYSKKSGSAKELWEELRLVYLSEEHGSRISLVKKYIEFQMVEGKSVLQQVQEFHQIADAITASGMFIEEKFHVSVIISKLPPSWKGISIKLLEEERLPVWLLMNHLKLEEESRGKGSADRPPLIRHDAPEREQSRILLKLEEESRGRGSTGRAHLIRHYPPEVRQTRNLGPKRTLMKKPSGSACHEMERDKKVIKFCSVCRKKGHLTEQCWFRKPGNKDDNSDVSAHAVTEC